MAYNPDDPTPADLHEHRISLHDLLEELARIFGVDVIEVKVVESDDDEDPSQITLPL